MLLQPCSSSPVSFLISNPSYLSFFLILCLIGYYSGVLSSSSTSGPLTLTKMTVKGGTSQACAACKYQRRKCTADCPLAPFFPPDQPKMFQNAHRLYGVSNIIKIIKNLTPSQKIEAMKSIIFQSNMRERYPVYGCVGIIAHLQHEIQQKELELEAVNTQLNIYRQSSSSSPSPPPLSQYPLSPQLQQLQLGDDDDSKHVLPLFNPQPFNSIPVGGGKSLPQQQYNCDEVYNANYIDTKENSFWLQHQYNNNNITQNQMDIQPQSFPSLKQQPPQPPPMEFNQDSNQDYYDAFFGIDDRQSFIGSKETYESTSESPLRDTKHLIEHVAENDLKDAAARFSLTSIE